MASDDRRQCGTRGGASEEGPVGDVDRLTSSAQVGIPEGRVEGAPEPSTRPGTKRRGTEWQRHVVTCRCERCDSLESYAR